MHDAIDSAAAALRADAPWFTAKNLHWALR